METKTIIYIAVGVAVLAIIAWFVLGSGGEFPPANMPVIPLGPERT